MKLIIAQKGGINWGRWGRERLTKSGLALYFPKLPLDFAFFVQQFRSAPGKVEFLKRQLTHWQTLGVEKGLLAMINQGILYLAILGAGEVWLRRGDKRAKILTSQSQAVVGVSGKVKAGDVLEYGDWQLRLEGVNLRRPMFTKSWLAVGFLFLLVGLIGMGWWQQTKSKQRQRLLAAFGEFDQKIELAQKVGEANPKQGLAVLSQAEEILTQAKKLGGRGESLNRRQRILESLKKRWGGRKSKLTPFYEFSLLVDNPSVLDWRGEGEELLILEKGRVFALNLANKRGEILLGKKEASGTTAVVLSGGRRLLLQGKEVFEIKNGSKQKLGELPSEPRLVRGWGGSLYYLDEEGSNLWKAVVGTQKVGEPVAWLRQEPSFNLNQVVDFAIDGSIWFLTQEGKLYRWFRGRPAGEFEFAGVGEAVGFLAVGEETIGFWDGTAAWVLNKKGELIARLPVEVANLRGLLLFKNLVLILTPEAIYELSLPQEATD